MLPSVERSRCYAGWLRLPRAHHDEAEREPVGYAALRVPAAVYAMTYEPAHDFSEPRYYLDGGRQLMSLRCSVCWVHETILYVVPSSKWRKPFLKSLRRVR